MAKWFSRVRCPICGKLEVNPGKFCVDHVEERVSQRSLGRGRGFETIREPLTGEDRLSLYGPLADRLKHLLEAAGGPPGGDSPEDHGAAFDAGRDSAMDDLAQLSSDNYRAGFQDGETEGFQRGYDQGRSEGYSEAIQEGR